MSGQDALAASLRELQLLEEGEAPEDWVSVNMPPNRDEGWKLHVSAASPTAGEVLRRLAPLLRSRGVPFKVAPSTHFLAELNDGYAGLSQVGKFLTVYPRSDSEAVTLAKELDAASADLCGPLIPSDRRLRPESLVHYRYGGFTDLCLTNALGHEIPAIRGPDGELIPDARTTSFQPPDWVKDPFRAAGIVELRPEPTSPLFEGYLILGVLRQAAKGGVYLALDSATDPPSPVVIKEGRAHLLADDQGRDVRQRLEHEAALLELLEKERVVPGLRGRFTSGENLYLVLEYRKGRTLEDIVAGLRHEGKQIPIPELLRIGCEAAGALARLHEAGVIVRDLTPSNVLWAPEHGLSIVDLELAVRTDSREGAFGWGTRGFVSPQQARGRRPARSDDLYALGATLFFAATGTAPNFLAAGRRVWRRAMRLLRPGLPPELESVVVECADARPARRPAKALEVQQRLASVRPLDGSERSRRSSTSRFETRSPGRGGRSARQNHLRLARLAGDQIVRAARRDGGAACWSSRAPTWADPIGAQYLPTSSRVLQDLHSGAAGIALFLAELGSHTGERRYLDTAEAAAGWLTSIPEDGRPSLPGLHFGRAGVAAFLARLAQLTGGETYLAAAVELAGDLGPAATDVPDVTHGWAGIGLLHLFLEALTGASGHLRSARACGDALLAAAETGEHGVSWRHPPGDIEGMSGEQLSGFAHGAAGIGCFLLELWRRTDDSRYLRPATGTAEWLIRSAEACLEDGSGLNWRLSPERSEKWFFWCHGAAGIGLFFQRGWALLGSEEYRDVAAAAARTVAEAGRRGGPTLCHGLAGNGDALLEAHLSLGDPRWVSAAGEFASLVELYARGSNPERGWPGDQAEVVTPDLMIGYAGVGHFMLRMSAPDQIPSPLLIPLSWPGRGGA